MPIKIRGELLLNKVFSAHLWEDSFHFYANASAEPREKD